MARWRRGRPGTAQLVAAAVLAIVAGSVTAGLVSRANQLAARYGEQATFPVAQRDLEVGDTIDDADVAWRALPIALIGGVAPEDPRGRTVIATILAGEAIVAERVAPDGVRGPMALAPADTRAVAVPTTGTRPPVAVGDRVDVYSVALDGASRAYKVATSAPVVDVSEEATTVAVTAGEVAGTARAALEQTGVIVLVDPSDSQGG